jgi:hypothetical protein
MFRRIAWTAAICLLALATAPSFGQRPPIADKVESPLLPSGITELSADLSAELATLFKDEDGTDAAHFVGEFKLTLDGGQGQSLQAAEAVVWIENRTHDNRPYRHVALLLWRDATVREVAGTATEGPLLFVTLNTFGEVNLHADEVARTPFADPTASELYQRGNALRKAIADAPDRLPDAQAALSIYDPALAAAGAGGPAPKPVIHFQAKGNLVVEEIEGRRVIIITGGVYLSRGVPGNLHFMEIQADNVVIYLKPEAMGGAGDKSGEPGASGAEPPTAGMGGETLRPRPSPPRRRPSDQQLMDTAFGEVEVEGAYLERDVRMTQGPHSIRASRLYYDFGEERALILDAVASTMVESRGVPLYLRAAEIRQLSANRFMARDAKVTTSEFHTPHYHIGAQRVDLTTTAAATGGIDPSFARSGTVEIRHATLNIRDQPVAYWPYVKGPLDTSETALRSVRVGYSGDFGLELQSDWHLFNLLGYETPKGFDATLSLDLFTERGPAAGIDVDYTRDTYFGLIRSYIIQDGEPDQLGQDREEVTAHDVRGRYLMRHRQYLEDDWQLSLELSYISDKTFLEEYFESEFDNEKEQETLLHLKKQRDNWAFTVLLQTRILDFLTQTERLPDLGFFLIGEPLGDYLTWFSENRAGILQYELGDRTFRDFLREGRRESSDSTARADTRQELEIPFDLGPIRFVPFVTGRGTTWSDSPDEGGLTRGLGVAGVRGSMYFSRVYADSKSELWDINGVRHIIKPDLVLWAGGTNESQNALYPFDDTIEGIDPTSGFTFGLRQRWQTKRGPADNRRTVDFFTWDIETSVFDDSDGETETNGYGSYTRPEESLTRNNVISSTIWRINDRTALLTEANYDINDGEMDILNVSLAVERTPRFSYLVGYRVIDETRSNLLGFGMNYRMTEKHTLTLRELFDLEEGETLDFTIGLIRKLPRWFTALSFEVDEAEDDFGVSFSIWPEGLPSAGAGSRRFTGLADSTLHAVE